MGESSFTWLESFYDLIYSSAIAQATSLLLYEEYGLIPMEYMFKFILIFIPIWWAWVGQTLFVNRYGKDSLRQRLFMFIQMIFVLIMTASLSVHFDQYYIPFLIGYLGIRFITSIQHFWIKAKEGGERRKTANFLGYGFLIGLSISLCSLFFDSWVRYLVLYIGIVFDILIPIFGRKYLFMVPTDMDHLLNRFGLFTIILFGQSIVSIIADLHVEQGNWRAISFALISFTIIFSMWWQYFGNLENHVDRNIKSTGQGIIYGHLFIYIALSVMAASIQLAFSYHMQYWFMLIIVFIATLIYFLSTTFVFHKYRFVHQRLKARHYLLFLAILIIFLSFDAIFKLDEVFIFLQFAIFFLIYARVTTAHTNSNHHLSTKENS